MRKIIKLILFCIILVLIVFNINVKTFSKSSTTVHYIFDRLSVDVGEEFTLSVILENYQQLVSVQFVCNIDEEVLLPCIKNDKYFQKPSLSIFDENEIYENSYTKNKGLRFSGLTKNGKTYGYSNANMVFTVSFTANIKIENVSEYFKPNIEETGIGSNIILVDKWLNNISYENNYCETLKANWDIEKYIVDVHNVLPNIINDIKILNRENGSYDIEIIDDEINLNKIGYQVIKVKIYDRLTTDIIYLASCIEVVDRLAPIVSTINSAVYIDDVKLKTETFEFFEVYDNYDNNLQLNYKYYTLDSTELNSLDDFISYLSKNKFGKVGCYSIDSSNNISSEVIVNVNILDTTKPVINEIKELYVDDTKIDEFSLESLIVLKDNYDSNPKLVINNKSSKLSIIDTLKTEYSVEIEYYGVDNANNETKHYNLKIYLKDTISPTIDNVLDIEIQDSDIDDYLSDFKKLEKDFVINDNFNKKLTIDRKYYINDVLKTKEEFIECLLLGEKGIIRYQVIDSYNNASAEKIQNVSIMDKTSPIIKINNIEDNGKYLKIDSLDYEVKDNLKAEINVKILLNDEEYNGESITKIGNYILTIKAKDIFGNENEETINFQIVDKNMFGCVDGINCKENNYASGILIGCGIVLLIGIIIVVEVYFVRKNKIED